MKSPSSRAIWNATKDFFESLGHNMMANNSVDVNFHCYISRKV